MTYSQWGRIQESTQSLPGVRQVSTAGHDGLMLTCEAARRLGLSPEVITLR